MTQVVSSISGLQVYAPSAGFAPTNSADVSAIASGYQVVSATSTELYAGTAFLTGVNGAPVSASRAGNAANAGMANSAYYDGTGRLISSLPDSAAVSAIASSYAESAASGKQDTLTFAYDDDKISAINGSALAGQGGVTGDYVEKSATEVAIGSANTASFTSFAQGSKNSALSNSFAQGNQNTATSNSFAQGEQNSASLYSFAQGSKNSARLYSFAQGVGNSAKNTAVVFGVYNLRGDGNISTGHSAAFVIGNGSYGARHDLMLVTHDGEITMYSSTADTVGTGIMSSIRAISAAATGGGVDSATVSAIASSYAESAASSKLDSSAIGTAEWMAVPMVTSISGTQISAITAAHADGADSAHTDADGRYLTALAAESSLSSKLDASASSSFYTTANESGFITGVDLTPYQTTAGMTAYQPAGDYQPSGDYYSASNPSGFVDSAYVDSAVSGKQDSLTFAYNADSAISSINGSAVAVGSVLVTGTAWDTASSASVYQPTKLSTMNRLVIADPNTLSRHNLVYGLVDDSGINYNLEARWLAPDAIQVSSNSTFRYMPKNSMWTTADQATGVFTPLRYATGACLAMDAATNFKAYYKGNEWFVADVRYGMLRGEIHQSRGLRIVASGENSASGFELHPSGVVGVSGVKAWALQPEGVSGIGGGGTAWQYGTAEYTQLTSVYDTVSANSASWGGIDSATCSAIASSYAESAASSKADSSALSSYVPYSSLEYNTASAISGINGSALAAGSTYSAGEGIDITDDVISVEAPVDIVAGPGIVIDNPDGNTLRVSMAQAEEVVLWETTSSGVDSGSITVSEAITNFEKYEIYGFETERGGTFVNTFAYSQIPFDYSSIIMKPNDNNGSYAFSINMFCAGNISQWRQTYFGCRCHWNSTFTEMTIDSNNAAYVNKDANGTFNSIAQKLRITKIVGIHRINGGN